MAKHSFGGSWTENKLRIIEMYLDSYLTALKKQRFNLLYIDCFAGSGYRTSEDTQQDLFDNSLADELKDGSARIALSKDGFDEYHFVEKDEGRYQDLQHVLEDFPEKSISIQRQDANAFLQEFCRTTRWRDNRAVLFIDPYGMQLDWLSLEAVAKTMAIDVWILIPVGIGPNRLLKTDGEIRDSWKKKLTRFFGCPESDWFKQMYKEKEVGQIPLFDELELEPEKVKVANLEAIAKYILYRLEQTFAHVAPNPIPLGPPSNPQMFYLFFAASNERGGRIGKRIATHLLKN
jgi:three-Cys-motif partner protein